MLRLGVDVGGTHTDAVVLDGQRVLGSTKVTTTPDVTSGIANALTCLRGQALFDPADVVATMIGTTHFLNALREGRHLTPTAAIRFGLPATSSLPPLVDWPAHMRRAVGGFSFLCHGGHEYDGSEIAAFDEQEFRDIVERAADAGARSFAISSVFSPVNAEMEQQAGEVIAQILPDAPVSLSHEIGRMGLLGRENATVMNATLCELAESVTASLISAVADAGIRAPVYVSQNDGTLMDVEQARRYPVSTFNSGQANAMRGAAFLSAETSCAVVDVGGTTMDVGMLRNGYPREASTDVDIAGVHVNVRMPDLLSVAIGGASIIRGETGVPSVGPESVGGNLREESLAFGGKCVTATDLAVAAGRADIGDPRRVAGLDQRLVEAALDHIADRVASVIDRMRLSAEPVPVIAVGGASFLVPDELKGASAVIRPKHHAVANAVGAAVAEVGGEVDRVYSVTQGQRDSVLDEARQEAVDRAVAAGARPASVRVVRVAQVPLAYLPGNATRIRVKAVGRLGIGGEE